MDKRTTQLTLSSQPMDPTPCEPPSHDRPDPSHHLSTQHTEDNLGASFNSKKVSRLFCMLSIGPFIHLWQVMHGHTTLRSPTGQQQQHDLNHTLGVSCQFTTAPTQASGNSPQSPVNDHRPASPGLLE
jgi:hypothetical protein